MMKAMHGERRSRFASSALVKPSPMRNARPNLRSQRPFHDRPAPHPPHPGASFPRRSRWRLLGGRLGRGNSPVAGGAGMNRKAVLQRILAKARAELNEIESREIAAANNKIIGNCYRFSNSYGSGDRWWLYGKV